MSKIKSLAGDTIVYGGSTILLRLLNWLLMPYYIRTMDGVQYGIVTQVYGYIAILLVILTYGFETSFFRFAKEREFSKVFTTAITSIVSTSALFVFLVVLLQDQLHILTDKKLSSELIVIVGILVAIDAISSIIFAKIRYEGKSVRFALLKLINIIILISFNLYFLYWVPRNFGNNGYRIVDWFSYSGNQSFFVLLSNLIASFSVLILILPDLFKKLSSVDFSLLKQMYKYSYPILIVGITGMVNMQLDKILIPEMIGGDEGLKQLAIYGANFKIGVLMAMFTQSFRLAFEPYFFKDHKKGNIQYANILTYFVLFGLLIFLGVTFFIDIINLLLTQEYIEGNIVIPIVLVSQLLSGIYFTLSVWYKVTDKTVFGAYMGIIGSLITIGLNVILIPILGYVGSAIAGLVCFSVMVVLSIYWGKKHSNIRYDWNKVLSYTIIVAVIYVVGIKLIPISGNLLFDLSSIWYDIFFYGMRIGLIIVFLGFVYLKEFRIKNI
ncbi:lipopolysaccharide biosynthesis protein [Labilibacter marinus]|uniref:lipopolysaccharide biosynthesis protein n=1 Tax=Labilibacter marinus TaxID=1477105 RepID=UPI000836AD83|nr:polysaccharide biosynthesis C-terminal domain-containing protein [Labilibacter marinus]